jgi:hypothetical protein
LEQFIAIAKGLAPQFLGINVDETRDDIAEEFATKLYQSNIKDVRQLINAMEIYEVWGGQKTVEEVIGFQDNYSQSILLFVADELLPSTFLIAVLKPFLIASTDM